MTLEFVRRQFAPVDHPVAKGERENVFILMHVAADEIPAIFKVVSRDVL